MKAFFAIIMTLVILAAMITAAFCLLLNHKEKHDSNLTAFSTNRGLPKDATFYERYVKRILDIIIAFAVLLISLPIVAVVAIMIYLEDPGNVIFKQKRIGINKSCFNIHKLRSMKQNTGDIPTHLLSREAQRDMILKIGRFIRKTSIDELGQSIEVLRGAMSIVGPRPALWNQYDLIAERDRYEANTVRPGITGLAQISGRDELEIPIKASLDGEYAAALHKSSWSGFKMDCKCFFGTFTAVLFSKGVVEGGTGELAKNEKAQGE